LNGHLPRQIASVESLYAKWVGGGHAVMVATLVNDRNYQPAESPFVPAEIEPMSNAQLEAEILNLRARHELLVKRFDALLTRLGGE
jgi:hypothetical protein